MKPVYWVIVVVLVSAVSFFGGMQYQKSQVPSFGQVLMGNRQGGLSRGSGEGTRMMIGANGSNRPVQGEIISSDEKSITVKMQDGSSKIVLLSPSTKVNKASEGSMDDLTTGEQVFVFGTTNSDGSVTAENVQVGQGGMMRIGGDAAAQPQR